MSLHFRAVIAWAFVMVAIPALPITAVLVPEPSTILVIGVLILVAIVASLVGSLFTDDVKK